MRTPFLHSQTLSELTGAEPWLKFENLQFIALFKERGALNRLLSLTPEQSQRGVVAVSASNHAQGVAFHAPRLCTPATIIMPLNTPRIKAARTESFGARVVLQGASFAEALATVEEYVASERLTLLHTFDDRLIIAGQGTVGLELIEDGPPLDAVIVSIGVGRFISGVATAIRGLLPATQVIGVQSEAYPSMAIGLGKLSGPVPGGISVAEGIAVATAGSLTLPHVAACVDDVVIVAESLIEDAVALVLQIEKNLSEGAGAAGLAAVLADPTRYRGRRVGLVLCGGNIDTNVLIAVLQRHSARAGQLVRLRVTTLDNAGPLGRITTIIGAGGGNILDVHHDRVFGSATARASDVVIDLELASPEQIVSIMNNFRGAGFQVARVPLAP